MRALFSGFCLLIGIEMGIALAVGLRHRDGSTSLLGKILRAGLGFLFRLTDHSTRSHSGNWARRIIRSFAKGQAAMNGCVTIMNTGISSSKSSGDSYRLRARGNTTAVSSREITWMGVSGIRHRSAARAAATGLAITPSAQFSNVLT